MRPRLVDQGRLRTPFVYPIRMVDRLERRYEEDRDNPIPLSTLLATPTSSRPSSVPWFPLGADALGRDVFSRVLIGARLSLGVAIVATLMALLLGCLLGALAGQAGGRLDDGLMRLAELVIALPAIYVVLALRAALPLVLTTPQVFGALVLVLGLIGWPFVARGVRAIIAAERRLEYAEAARAAGAGRTRILLCHLLPATRGFLGVQATLLVPAFILAEATMSFVGLGFAEPVPSWGVMLQDAGRGRALVEAPWLFAPAVAIVMATFAAHLAVPHADLDSAWLRKRL
jgi:peptide/nickel transport system permease protein